MPITILRENGLSALVIGDLETIAQGFQFTEGPLELADGSLLFQDIKAERTYVLPAGTTEAKVLREQTGAANGQTFGPDGWIYFCEQNGRRVSRMKPDGSSAETVVEEFDGMRLNSPNDVVAHSNGRLYFTDPPYGAPPDRPLHFQGVYSLDPETQNIELLLKDFEKPNGLALSPDESILYVCDTAKYHVRAFSVEPSGFVDPATGRVFAVHDPETQGGPDGMKVDQSGRVYVAVAQGVWVYEPDGRLLGIIPTPARPSNLAWRGQDAATLAITAVDKVHQIQLKTSGLLPVLRPWA
jgi:gluconolactonase